MDKVILKSNNFKVKGRDIVLFLITVFLLLFLSGCSNDEGEILGTQIDFENNTCEVSQRNMTNIEQLLEQSDFDDDEWIKQLDEYIQIMKDQNQDLVDDYEYSELYEMQAEVDSALENLKNDPNEQNLQKLKLLIKDYKSLNSERCKAELE